MAAQTDVTALRTFSIPFFVTDFTLTPIGPIRSSLRERLNAPARSAAHPPPRSKSFRTADCRKTVAELKSKGVEFLSEPKDQFYGIEAIFRDPFGNWFSLSQPKNN